MPFSVDGSNLVCETAALRIVISGVTGTVLELRNNVTGHRVVDVDSGAPWRLRPLGTSGRPYTGGVPWPGTYHHLDPQPTRFVFSVAPDAASAALAWDTSTDGVRVEVTARIVDEALELWPRVEVADGVAPPASLEYPLLVPQPLASEAAKDQLVYPAQAGWVIRAPLDREPLVSLYPDGYSGSSVQFMAYYESGAGGVYLACHDPHATAKRIRFGHDRASFEHIAWDERAGASLDLGYPVVIAALTRGDWHEAADRYRAWALPNAPWCASKPANAERSDRERIAWLYEGVGLSIWGAPSSLDWGTFYRHYAEVAGKPLHVVPGWDWPQTLPPTLGSEGVFPAKFHEANRAAWEGHYVTPYMNDIFISSYAPDFFERWEPNLLFPYTAFSWLEFAEPPGGWVDGGQETPKATVVSNHDFFVCPLTEPLNELHCWRDRTLADEYGVDGAFYDISSGNPENWSRCLRAGHGHAPGQGRKIITAYAELNRNSKHAAESVTGRYFAQGVEVINETLVGAVDFYVSRACAGPVGLLETWMIGPEDPPGGSRELVPLFQAVYHDVGPVHEDGWIGLSTIEGSLFYWISARIYLEWGGILSLQYSTAPPEQIDTEHGPAETVLWNGATHRWDELPPGDPAKHDFIRQLAQARTGFGRDYLAYGRMLRAVPLETEQVELDFRYELYGWGSQGVVNEGRWPVPDVLHAAWLNPDGNVGLFFVNLGATETARHMITLQPRQLWGLDLAGAEASVVTASEREVLGVAGADGGLTLNLSFEPRRVTLVELRRAVSSPLASGRS
jgi:hypothetical protein